MNGKTVTFTVDKFLRFKKSYNAAKRTGQTTFSFDGDEYDVAFASYVIEYLTIKFNNFIPV